MPVPPLPPPVDGTPGVVETPWGRVRTYARGAGRPVVLLHSFNAAATAYEVRPLFDRLARTRRAIAVDWLGFGTSDRPDVPYGADLYREVLRRVLRSVTSSGAGASRAGDEAVPDVVALSLPAQYVVSLVVRDPGLVRRLVLVSPTGFGRFGGRPSWRRSLAYRYLRTTGLGGVLFGVLARRRVIAWFLARIYADPGAVDPGYAAYSWASAQQPGASRAPLRFVTGMLDDPDAACSYTVLDVPTLLVFGEVPRFSDPTAANALLETNPNLALATVSGSGDLPQLERPDVAAALVAGWLA